MYRKIRFYDLRYYHFVGSWAWILHRLSGLALIFYLCLHIWVIHTLTLGAESFNRTMVFLNSWPFKLLEIGLWGVILFHAFNGARVVIVDFFHGAQVQKKWFVLLIGLAAAAWAAGSFMILSHMEWRF